MLFLRFVFGLLSGWKIQTWPIIRFLTESSHFLIFYRYNGQLSDKCTVNTGAHQGSVISPVLFSLYINDFMIHNFNFKLFKYADDMALV